jgi:molybdate transport system permease protein
VHFVCFVRFVVEKELISGRGENKGYLMAETSLPARRSRLAHAAGRGDRQTLPLLLASLPMLVFLLIPLLALMLRVVPAQLLANLIDPQVAQAIWLSIITTLISLLLTILAGTPTAYLLARRRFRGRGVLDTLIDLPMVLPPSVAGIALLVAFGRRGLLGQYLNDVGLTIAFTQAAVVLAQTFVAAPFYIKSAATGFATVDRELEQAAAIDGASRSQVFRLVTLPLAWRALLGGAVMTWARALGEFGATIIFAGNFPGRTQTMPLAIYIGFELELNVALTLSVILLGTSFLVLFVVKGILRQRV